MKRWPRRLRPPWQCRRPSRPCPLEAALGPQSLAAHGAQAAVNQSVLLAESGLDLAEPAESAAWAGFESPAGFALSLSAPAAGR